MGEAVLKEDQTSKGLPQFYKFTQFLQNLQSLHRQTMAEYKVEVKTGDMKNAGTWDHIFITLFGTAGQSERTELNNYGIDFKTGTVSRIQVNVTLKLGPGH